MVGCVSLSWMATFSGKDVPILIVVAESADKIGERACDKKVLLHEAQRLARARGIVGIEHAGDGFGCQRFRESADKIAGAEFAENQNSPAPPRPTNEAY